MCWEAHQLTLRNEVLHQLRRMYPSCTKLKWNRFWFRTLFSMQLYKSETVSRNHSLNSFCIACTVKPRYIATFGPGHDFGERRGWRLNGGSARMRLGHKRASVYARTMCCMFIGLLLADTPQLKVMHQRVNCINHCAGWYALLLHTGALFLSFLIFITACLTRLAGGGDHLNNLAVTEWVTCR